MPGGNGSVDKGFSGTNVRNWLLLASVRPLNSCSKTPPSLTEPKEWFIRSQNVHSSGVVLNSVNSVHAVVPYCAVVAVSGDYLRLRQATEPPAAHSLPKTIKFLNFCLLWKRSYYTDNSVILGYCAPPLCVRYPAFLDGSVASPLKFKGPRSNMDRWPLKMNSLRNLESLDSKYPVPEVSILYEAFLRFWSYLLGRSALILSYHVRLYLPNSPSHEVFPQKLVRMSHRSMRAKFLANIFVIDYPDNEKYKLWQRPFCTFSVFRLLSDFFCQPVMKHSRSVKVFPQS